MERYKIHSDSAIYYVTFTVIQWLPLFVHQEPCKIIIDSLNYCSQNKDMIVVAYVVMPTHMHAVLADKQMDAKSLSKSIDDFRKFTGRQLADYCDRNGPPAFSAALREEAGPDRDRRLWQPSRHPELIYSEAFMRTKIDYIHNNPVRAGLVRSPEHWRLSSAAFYGSYNNEDSDVIISTCFW